MRRLLVLLALVLLVPALPAFAAQSATTDAAKGVGPTSATVTATVDPDGQPATVAFQYGTTTQYGTETSGQTVAAAGPVERALTGLTPATTYHFRVVVRSPGGEVVGADRVFTTEAAPPPTVSTGTASAVRSTGATVAATVDPRGAETKVVVDYGPTASYGSTAAAQTIAATAGSTTVTFALRGLNPRTTYHYRARATSASGQDLGADRTFTTPRPAAPSITTGSITDVSAGAAVVHATIDPKGRAGTASLEFGTAANKLTSRTPALSVDGGRQGIQLLLTPLKAKTRFYVRVVVATDGGTGRGTVKNFVTPAAPKVGTLTLAGPTVVAGHAGEVAGKLEGPGAAGALVTLEGVGHPFAAPLAPLGLTTTASATGAFRLMTPVLTRRTRLRVKATLGGTEVFGPVASIPVRPSVRTSFERLRGGRLRVIALVRPAGAYRVSLLRSGRRVTTLSRSGPRGRYVRTIRRRAASLAVRVVKADRSLTTVTTRPRRVAAR